MPFDCASKDHNRVLGRLAVTVSRQLWQTRNDSMFGSQPVSQSAAVLIELPEGRDDQRAARFRKMIELDAYSDWDHPEVEIDDDDDTRALWNALNENEPTRRSIWIKYYDCRFLVGTYRLRNGRCGFYVEGDVMDMFDAFDLRLFARLLKSMNGKTGVFGSFFGSVLVEFLAGEFNEDDLREGIWAAAGLAPELLEQLCDAAINFPRDPEIEVEGIRVCADERFIERYRER